MMNLATFAALVIVCLQLVHGQISLVSALASFMLSYSFFGSIRQLQWIAHEALLGIGAAQNVANILDIDTERIHKEDREKQKELLSAGNDKEKIKKIEEEILALQEERKALLIKESDNRELQDRIEGMIRFLDEQPAEIEEYSEDLARRLIKKVTVYDRKMTVEFKSGFTVDVDE
jgi:ABC-type multidrug transport system fused ATPase/permease subunit